MTLGGVVFCGGVAVGALLLNDYWDDIFGGIWFLMNKATKKAVAPIQRRLAVRHATRQAQNAITRSQYEAFKSIVTNVYEAGKKEGVNRG